uniref:hypothetical protein n=1 Tax=Paractinoplanes polyasparticus TaxID=2856853 RepID=UPI001C8467EA|nr:hypothetical protein [Actinoplanes polyasparticus]
MDGRSAGRAGHGADVGRWSAGRDRRAAAADRRRASPGHTSYLVTAGAERLLCFGDAFHHPLQLNHIEWGSVPDRHGDSVPAARRRLIDEMLVPGTVAFAFHFGDQPFGRVARATDGTVTWNPVPSTVITGPPRLLSRL